MPGIELDTAKLDVDFDSLLNVPLVVLTDHSRAGNNFVMRLFDMHPQVFAIVNAHYLLGAIYKYSNGRNVMPSAGVLDFLIEDTDFGDVARDIDDTIIEKYKRMGDDIDGTIDRVRVRAVLSYLLSRREHITYREIVVAMHVAYAEGIGRDISNIQYILQTDIVKDENLSFISYLEEQFPDCRFFHLVRDPRASFASLRQQFVNQRGTMYPVLVAGQRWLTTRYGGIWMWAIVSATVGARRMNALRDRLPNNRYLRVRNEDINCDFVVTMQKISNWLGVPVDQAWLEKDYTPTSNGQIWQGLSAYSKTFSQVGESAVFQQDDSSRSFAGPNPGVTERWKKRLRSNEIAVLEYVFFEEMRENDYAPMILTGNHRGWRNLIPLFSVFQGEFPKVSGRAIWNRREHMAEFVVSLLFFPVFYVYSRYMFLRKLFGGAFKYADETH